MEQIKEMAPKTPKFDSSIRSTKPSMSPAASIFAQRLGIRIGTDKLAKSSSSPARTPNSTAFSPAVFRMVKVKDEPKSGSSTPKAKIQQQLGVTDNLLQLPNSPLTSASKKKQRSRASDFF